MITPKYGFHDRKTKKYALWGIFLLLILSIFVIAFVGDEIITGYTIGRNLEHAGQNPEAILEEINSMESEIDATETNLKSCQLLNENYLEKMLEYKNQHFVCQEEKKELLWNISWMEEEYEMNLEEVQEECDEKKSQAEINLAELQIEYEELQEETSRIIENAANNKCCKEKVDNPKIDSYTLTNDKIVCTTNGKNDINC